MPHVIIEHSENLTPRVDINALIDTLHATALETGVFPLGGLRTRAVARQHYRIADGHADNAFCHVVLRIGHGRDDNTKLSAGEQMFAALTDFLESDFRQSPLSISLELQEIDPVLNFKKNNLHELVKTRQEQS